MTDLTKITTPFGLLDPETQEALKAHGGWIEYYTPNGWVLSTNPLWLPATTYRVKPEPPKPREFWVNVYPGDWHYTYDSREAADRVACTHRIACMHVREVLE